jgi:membrane protease YdiL (CAAX protease family)
VKERLAVRNYALLALLLFGLAEIAFSVLSISLRGQSLPVINLANAITSVFVRWIPTLVVVRWVEKRGLASLGLALGRKWIAVYGVMAGVCLVVPALFVGFDSSLLLEFVEQIVYIGLLEEFFYRGYLMNRLCQWLGKGQGLFWSSFIFGAGHVISRVADHGFSVLDRALATGGEAFLGGLIFGGLFLLAGNIWPGAILHISTNMYLGRILALFGG